MFKTIIMCPSDAIDRNTLVIDIAELMPDRRTFPHPSSMVRGVYTKLDRLGARGSISYARGSPGEPIQT